jgi:arylsulfatase
VSAHQKRVKAVFTYNLLGFKRVRWESAEALSPGKHTIIFDFKYDGLGFATLAFNDLTRIGRPGTGTLTVDGQGRRDAEDGAYDSAVPANR